MACQMRTICDQLAGALDPMIAVLNGHAPGESVGGRCDLQGH